MVITTPTQINRQEQTYLQWFTTVVEPYGSTLDNCYISDNSYSSDIIDSSDSSDSKQEQTCLQDFASVCISDRHNLGFGGPWVCAVSALVLELATSSNFFYSLLPGETSFTGCYLWQLVLQIASCSNFFDSLLHAAFFSTACGNFFYDLVHTATSSTACYLQQFLLQPSTCKWEPVNMWGQPFYPGVIAIVITLS